MDVETKASSQTAATLSKSDQKRLERLAKLAGRTPRSMLRFVLRDGFDACEVSVLENIEAEAGMARGEFVTHAEVMQCADAYLQAACEKRKKHAG